MIRKYNPYVIDISRYFMGDANIWDNLNASHFEKEFYRETYDQIVRIVNGEPTERYFETVNLFNADREGYQEDLKRKFDVDYGLELLKILLGKDDALVLNILDKLYSYVLEDERVKQYMDAIFQ